MIKAKYGPEAETFLLSHYKGISTQELVRKVNEALGTNYTPAQIRSWKDTRRLRSGYDTRYKPGHTPAAKGQKITQNPGSVETRFKKGEAHIYTKPIGTERTGSGGYVYVKVRERERDERNSRNYKLKQRVIWEAAHGPLKDDERVIFLDGNRKNFSLENLAAVTQKEHGIMVGNGLRSKDPRLTEVGVTIAKLKAAIAEKREEAGQDGRK